MGATKFKTKLSKEGRGSRATFTKGLKMPVDCVDRQKKFRGGGGRGVESRFLDLGGGGAGGGGVDPPYAQL